MNDDGPFGKFDHDNNFPEHSKKCGHYCLEFDGLWVCEDCSEFHVCTCMEKTPEQKERADKYHAEMHEYNEKNPIDLTSIGSVKDPIEL